MTREQFIVVIFGFLVIAAVAVWLMWHLIWRPVWEERQHRLAAERAEIFAAQGLDERMPMDGFMFHQSFAGEHPFGWPSYSPLPVDWKRDRLL